MNQTITILNVKPIKETIIHASDCSNMYTDKRMMERQAIQQEGIPRGKPHASLQEGSNTVMT
jgi:hypothetical protein